MNTCNFFVIGYLLILFVPIFSNMIIKRGNSIIVNIDISEVMALKNKNWTKLYSFLIYVLVKMINNHEEFRTVINDKGKVGGYFITVLYSFS